MHNAADRNFTTGETVFLRARISKPGTKVPTDPTTVELASLTRDADRVVVVVPSGFTRQGEGDYFLGIATDGFEVGSYTAVIRTLGPSNETPRRVVLLSDQFVLEAV